MEQSDSVWSLDFNKGEVRIGVIIDANPGGKLEIGHDPSSPFLPHFLERPTQIERFSLECFFERCLNQGHVARVGYGATAQIAHSKYIQCHVVTAGINIRA